MVQAVVIRAHQDEVVQLGGAAVFPMPDVVGVQTTSGAATGHRTRGITVLEGTTICIEPMVVLGDQDNVVLDDEWTVATRDRSRAAHWEHSVAATSAGLCVLTAVDGGAARLGALGVPHAPLDPA